MPRPAGYELSRTAWEDVLRITGQNLTQVAKLAEVPRPTLSALLGGYNRASVPMAHRIAKAAGVHPETLFPGMRAQVNKAA